MSTDSHAPAHHEHYIVPIRNYVINALVLAFLMTATIVAAKLDLGPMNPVVAIGIAVTKAVLIVLFFMNTWYSSRLTWVFVIFSFFWLFILIGMFLPDYFARDFSVQPNAWSSAAQPIPNDDMPMDKRVVPISGHGEH